MELAYLTAERFNLGRFLEAQEGTYEAALAEIRLGAKRTHWMWFIFPQLTGLGSSSIAMHYAISSLVEARAYLGHPVLGARYAECVSALQDLTNTTAEHVFGAIDPMKLRSSLTLFAQATSQPSFEAALIRWFGSPDRRTLDLLSTRSADAEHSSA